MSFETKLRYLTLAEFFMDYVAQPVLELMAALWLSPSKC